MANGLMGGIGAGLSGFEEAFSRGQERQDFLSGRQADRAMQQAVMQQAQDERTRQRQGQEATNAAISVMMGFGGGYAGQPQQAPPVGIASPEALAGVGQQVAGGSPFAGADMTKVLAARSALVPKKAKIVAQEMTGPQGFGTYAVNLDDNTIAPRFLGGGKPTSAKDKGESFKLERQLSKEWEGVNKDFRSVDQQYNTIKTAGKEGTGVGDIGMIFAMMKMFDPGSVVRESEFALAQNADSVAGILSTTYARLKEGEKLRPEQRAKFLDLADKLYSSTNDLYGRRLGEYRGAADSYGFDVDRTISDVKRGGWKKKEGSAPSGFGPNTQLQSSRVSDATSAADALIEKALRGRQ